jgi:hypothetical protein
MSPVLFHVEAQVAGIMRRLNVKEATLYLNASPCKGRAGVGCRFLLPEMLPEGASLKVWSKNEFGHVKEWPLFVGLPD